jgi:hypothetical protein
MKHLRKINNFNSYLALLSALDSAPIRRLEWQKHITEGLKEYCALIDSSSSFRAYRQALAETQPPCIPYMYVNCVNLTIFLFCLLFCLVFTFNFSSAVWCYKISLLCILGTVILSQMVLLISQSGGNNLISLKI